MNDFSEKGVDRRFEVPAWYIFQSKTIPDEFWSNKNCSGCGTIKIVIFKKGINKR